MHRPGRAALHLALACSLLSCTGSPPPSHAIPTRKVAFFQDLSIDDPLELVSPSFRALQLALVEDGSGAPVVLRAEPFDTRGDAAVALRFARRVAADAAYVAVVVAPFWGEPAEVAAVFARAGLPVLSLSPVDPVPPSGAVWRRLVAGQDVQAATLAAALDADTAQGGSACLGDDGSPYASGLRAMVDASLETTIAARFVAPPHDQGSLGQAVSSIRAAHCRVVGWTGFPDGARSLRDALSSGGLVDIPIAGADAMKVRSYLTQAAGAEGTIVTCPCADVTTSADPGAQRFVHDYQAATGLEPGPYAAEGWDAAGILLGLIEGGARTRGAVGAGLARIHDAPGVAGGYRFGSDGSVDGSRVPTYRARGLRWVATGVEP